MEEDRDNPAILAWLQPVLGGGRQRHPCYTTVAATSSSAVRHCGCDAPSPPPWMSSPPPQKCDTSSANIQTHKGTLRPNSHRMRSTLQHAHANCGTLWSMGVFTWLASDIKGFARKCANASCVNGASAVLKHHRFVFCPKGHRTITRTDSPA